MTDTNQKRKIVIVTEQRIFHGYLTNSRMGGKTTDASLIDLLSNPIKTQPYEKFLSNPKSNLLSLSDTQIHTVRNNNFEKRAQVFIPTSSILFAFESRSDGYKSHPDFKIQANMEQSKNELVEISISEYNFEGYSNNFFGRYNNDNVHFIAITSATLSFVDKPNPELSGKDFYALNKFKINNIAVVK
jgi:hypothetical protein